MNEVMKETYIKNFPFVVAKLDVIYNGFDRESIDRVKPIIFKEVAVSYVGTLYAYRNPMLILKGAKIFRDRGGEGVKIIFAGELKPPWNSNLRKRIFKMKLNDLIEMRGYVKREEAISIMKGSSALIHIVGNYPAGLSAKIFEYVYTGKPICVIKDESGVVVNFLKKVGANYYHCRSAGEFDRFLEDLLSGKIKGKPFPEKILNFTREKMAKKFMEIVEEVVR